MGTVMPAARSCDTSGPAVKKYPLAYIASGLSRFTLATIEPNWRSFSE